MIDRIINTWFDFGNMLEKKFKHGNKLFEAITCAIGILAFIVAGGWIITYDSMTLDNDSWTKSDNIMHYSGMVFLIIFVGAAIEAMILIGIFGLLAVAVTVCVYGWFIVLPLLLVFLSICFGRWLVVRKRRKLQ